jgi:hypothetical protein
VQINGPLLVPELVSPGRSAGFLGRSWDPLDLGKPGHSQDFHRALESKVSDERLNLLEKLDRRSPQPAEKGLLVARAQATDFLQRPGIGTVFQLSQEKPEYHERYGKHPSGQACMLARRLVEAGVPWITVFYNESIRGQDKNPILTDAYGWDTHNDIFSALKEHLLPRFDRTISAFLDDLQDRGLLDQTLVVLMGEFGRAPRVAREAKFAGEYPGRKHWSSCYSIVLAGGGISAGVYGESDRIAAFPKKDLVTPGDFSATLLSALGIESTAHYHDSEGRPYRAATGNAIPGLLS